MAVATIPSYVNQTTVSGEVFIYRAYRHWIALFLVASVGSAGRSVCGNSCIGWIPADCDLGHWLLQRPCAGLAGARSP
jgi:hypothetical protein